MKKGSKYIRKSRIDNWALGSGFLGLGVVGLFLYLSMLGAIEITGYSYTEHCAGSITEPCFLYINFTANNNIYIKADSDWLRTEGELKELVVQRSWGSTWRTIYLNQTWSKRVKYAIKFAEGKDYQIRFIAYKNHPKDEIDWDFNPKGTWKGGLAQIKCDMIDVPYQTKEVQCEYTEHFDPKNGSRWNTSVCSWVTVTKYNQVCDEKTKRFEYADDKIEYVKENVGCTAYTDKIICDDGFGADGNGDGICSAGETCYTYNLEEGIELDTVKNGQQIIEKPRKRLVKAKIKGVVIK